MSSRAFRCCLHRMWALVVLVSVVFPVSLGAQGRPATDPVYLRAHRLVAQGRGDAGRALVDSMLKSAMPGTAEYAEALFWRASTAVRGEDAERDYIRIAIEYPLSARAEEALIRLAEIEMLRGDRVPAQRHLQRLVIEYPNGPSRARASYWLARIFFEANETARGCHELNVARGKAAPGDVELRNQVDYEAHRCAIVDPGPAVPATVSPATPPGTPPATPPVAVTPTPAVPVPSPTGSGALPGGAGRVGAPMYTVQVAAFPGREAATTFMESLQAKGYDVRIWGTESPFRVRIGRFATRAEANALAAELRAKSVSRDAWVTEAEVR